MFHLGKADMHAVAIRVVIIVQLKSVSKSGKAARSPLVVGIVVDYSNRDKKKPQKCRLARAADHDAVKASRTALDFENNTTRVGKDQHSGGLYRTKMLLKRH